MKKLLFGTASTLAITLVSILNVASTTTADFDELGIQQELRNHGEQLDNHEDRITNTEADVRVIQEKTATPPAETRVIVREVSTPRAEQKTDTQAIVEPEPTPEPQTIVVKSTSKVEGESPIFYYCDLTYSDGIKSSILVGKTSDNSLVIHYNCDSYVGRPKPKLQ